MIRPKLYIAVIDLLLAYACLVLAHALRFGSLDSVTGHLSVPWPAVVLFLGVTSFSSYFFELYDRQKFTDRKFFCIRSTLAGVSSFLVLSAMFYMFPALQIGRGLLLISLLLLFAGQCSVRLLLHQFSGASQFAQRILIVGAGDLAQRIAAIIPEDNNIHSFVRFVACTEREPVVDSSLIVGKISEIDNLIHDYRPQKLVIALQERRGNLPLREFMRSKMRGVEILEATTFFEQQKGCLLVENMQPSTFVYTHRFRMTPFMRSYKRLYDIVFSLLGLLMTAPLFPLLAVAIKLDSSGPVFFKQLRVGENETEYFLYKFRTMSNDAEKNTGAVWAQQNDPRVTRVGRFMRKTRLDEIPQLYNVLKGDMSFIGPRPERMPFVERLKESIPFYSTRHFVKPGVTGLAQVCYPYGASDEDALEKLRYDLFYIKNYSILLDFRIILDTIRVVTSGFGGR